MTTGQEALEAPERLKRLSICFRCCFWCTCSVIVGCPLDGMPPGCLPAGPRPLLIVSRMTTCCFEECNHIKTYRVTRSRCYRPVCLQFLQVSDLPAISVSIKRTQADTVSYHHFLAFELSLEGNSANSTVLSTRSQGGAAITLGASNNTMVGTENKPFLQRAEG